MSSSAAIKVKKVSKDKQADATDSKNDDLHNSFDSREEVEDKDTKEAPKSKPTTKKGTKKAGQAKEQEPASAEEPKESQGEQDAARKEEQKTVEQADGKAPAKKGKKQKKADDKNADDQANSQINTEANEKKKEVKKTEGDETNPTGKPKELAKKAAPKVETAAPKKPEVVVQADLTANKPKVGKEAEVKSPNPKGKEAAAPVKNEPHKIISLGELKKHEKEAPVAKQNPTTESLPSNRKELSVDAGNKNTKPNQANPPTQKSVQSPKNPPAIDLNATKGATPQTATSPKPIQSKIGSMRTANVAASPAVESKPVEGKIGSPKNPLREVSSPGKDVKSPRNAKAPVVETKKGDETGKNLTKKPTAVLEKQKTIPQNDKSVNVKSGKGEPIQSRVYTEGAEKVKPTSATIRNAAKSPQTHRQEGAGKNPDYFSPRGDDKNKANKGASNVEKVRMRSFDAGKTDKINPEDPFEVRSKMWQIRKQERLLQEEKKQLRKDTQECTFSPRLNQKSLSKQLSPYDIYERGVEWNEKVKTALTEQREKNLEDIRKPTVTKSRLKSDTFVPTEPRRSTLEGFSGPQFGTSRGIGVPTYSQEPLEYKTNLETQISEIRDIFDNVASTLKAKASRQSGTFRTPEQQETPRTKTEETKKTEKVPSSQFKPSSAKSPTLDSKEDANRIDSLKGILKLKQDVKRVKGKEQPKKGKVDEGDNYFISESFKPEEMVKNPRQIEIRNNRYVMIDNNLSSIEKKDTVDSNDVSLNFESTEAK